MAFLFITRSTREVRELTNGTFPSEYFNDEYSEVIKIENENRNSLLRSAIKIPIVPFQGNIDIPSWVNPEDGFTYRVKRFPDYDYILNDSGKGLISAVVAFPENKEERLQ